MKQRFNHFAQTTYLPGFQGFSLFEVGSIFIEGLQKGAITNRASSVAFNSFLALFPATIFLFTLIPFIPIHNFQSALFDLIKEVMPKAGFEAAEETIIDIVHHQHKKMLSIGFLSALYFSTNGVHSMIDGFNNSYHQIETRSFIRQRLVSLALVIIVTIVLIATIAIIIFTEVKIGRLPKSHYGIYLIQLGRLISVFILFLVVISFNYFLGPASKQGWQFFSPGSILATCLSLLTSFAFAYYVNHFGKYNKLYGSIGTLLIVMMWMYLNCLVILVGFELNASIQSVNAIKNQKPI